MCWRKIEIPAGTFVIQGEGPYQDRCNSFLPFGPRSPKGHSTDPLHWHARPAGGVDKITNLQPFNFHIAAVGRDLCPFEEALGAAAFTRRRSSYSPAYSIVGSGRTWQMHYCNCPDRTQTGG